MQLYYFISADGRRLGPVPGEELVNCGITHDTLVWGQNMTGWAPADTVPEIVALFTSQTRPTESQSSWPLAQSKPNHIFAPTKVASGEVVPVEVNGVRFKMIKVDGGTFTMGATAEQGDDYFEDEQPTHQVTLSDYYIGETEVTQELWEAVMGNNPSYITGNSRYPVENVSWNDCQTFIQKLNRLTGKNFRLPTEAEWEFAARGGNSSKGYKYSGSNSIDDVAWYESTSDMTTHQVGTKSPNELGIYDMSGNVWEWCSDWFGYGYYSSSSQTDPSGPADGSCRVLRGGSWDDNDTYCRVSDRRNDAPDYQLSYYGFRLVCSSL